MTVLVLRKKRLNTSLGQRKKNSSHIFLPKTILLKTFFPLYPRYYLTGSSNMKEDSYNEPYRHVCFVSSQDSPSSLHWGKTMGKTKKVKDDSVLRYYFFGCRLLPITALHSENNVRGRNNNKPQTLTDQRLSNWEKIGLGEYLKILLYVQDKHSPELTLLRFWKREEEWGDVLV